MVPTKAGSLGKDKNSQLWENVPFPWGTASSYPSLHCSHTSFNVFLKVIQGDVIPRKFLCPQGLTSPLTTFAQPGMILNK